MESSSHLARYSAYPPSTSSRLSSLSRVAECAALSRYGGTPPTMPFLYVPRSMGGGVVRRDGKRAESLLTQPIEVSREVAVLDVLEKRRVIASIERATTQENA